MKYALIIGNNKYNDPKLAQLKTPAADSTALAKVLDDKMIGSFDEVTPLINQTETRIRRAISTFLTNKKPDDLVLLYFSGHGVLDDRGRLYLALKDTQVDLLKATSIPSSFVADEMDSCRSKRQILVLDCCHSGAFGRGTKGEQKAVTETTFEGSGFGRVVLTASDSTQYAFEGDQVIKQTELSLFTHFLLEGLKTGQADTNNDGHISLDEWYDYTYGKVISETPRQVPHKWSYNQQGDIIIARNPYVKKRVVELPNELLQALESSFVGIRESAVTELGKYLRSRDSEIVNLAISALEKMKADDSRRISSLAERLLSEFEQARAPAIKVAEVEAKTATAASDGPMPLPKMMAEIESPTRAETAQPVVEKLDIPVDRASASRKFVFDRSFWFKWIGTSILAFVFSVLGYEYNINFDGSGTSTLVLLFAALTGLSSLIQWSLFRNRLTGRWIAENIAAGVALGLLHNFVKSLGLWWEQHLGIVLVLWLVGNYVLGLFRIGKIQESSRNSSSVIEAGARQNIFLLLLSISLVLASIANILLALELHGFLDPFWILYGISAMLVSISIMLKKDIPRNVGFITLAVFMFFDGINVVRLASYGEYPMFYFALNGIAALVSGFYFVSQGATWKNFGFIMLSGFLISTAVAGISVNISELNRTFLILSILFAIPAAVFFFLRKEQKPVP